MTSGGSLAQVARRSSPVSLAGQQLLAVHPVFASLLPDGGLRRGSVLATTGPVATSLAIGLAAGPSQEGSWVGVVGDRAESLGLLAIAESGVELQRLIVVRADVALWAQAAAALIDSVDVVVALPPRHLALGDARRLQARVRERGAVVVVLGNASRFEIDITLASVDVRRPGLGQGYGHLQGFEVDVEATGRRAATRTRRAALRLGADGWSTSEAPQAVFARGLRPRTPSSSGSLALTRPFSLGDCAPRTPSSSGSLALTRPMIAGA